MNQYKMGDSPTEAPPTGSGVLSGYSLSVSRRIPAEDRKMSVRVIAEQGGTSVHIIIALYNLTVLKVISRVLVVIFLHAVKLDSTNTYTTCVIYMYHF